MIGVFTRRNLPPPNPGPAMKRFLPFLPAVLAAVCTFAADITPTQAAQAARAWVARGYAEGVLPVTRSVSSVESLVDSATDARLFVAKFRGGGFVVLSGDDRIAPVLAFSAEGNGVSTDPRNPFWALLRGDIAFREAASGVARGRKSSRTGRDAAPQTVAHRQWTELLGGVETDKASKSSAKASALWDVRVDALVDARWNQETASATVDSTDWCYNYYTPNHYPCGCVATAIGQMMWFHRHPSAPVKAATYTCAVDGKPKKATMKAGTYDWSKMPAKPWKKATLSQRKAIGKLLYDVGVSVQMDWGMEGSGAVTLDGATALVRDFGYANAATYRYGTGLDAWSLQHFKKQVVPSLEAGSPVVLSIISSQDAYSGHAVLADGYGYSETDFFIHVNFGWGAKDDTTTAWYAPPTLAETAGITFDTIRGFICNIFPTKTGNVFSGRVVDRFDNPLSGIKVTLSDGQTTQTSENGIYAFVAKRSAGKTINFAATAVKDGVKASCPTNMLFGGNSPANNIVLSFVTVTLDANGGKCAAKTRAVPYAKAMGKLPVPTRAGCIFLGWYTAKTGGTKVSAATKLSADRTLYARWQAAWTVSFDANGGKCATKTRLVKKGAAVGALPSATRAGCQLLGWYTAKTGGGKVSAATKVTKNRTFFARWEAVCTVTFDPNGGTCATQTRVVAKGAAIGELPAAERDGFRFLGWFPAKSGGEKIESSAVVAADRTLFAQWEELPPETPTDDAPRPELAPRASRRGGAHPAQGLDFTFDAQAGKTYELQWCGALGPGAVW